MNKARWRARAVLDKWVPVELGEARRLTVFGRRAAVPARSVIDTHAERRLEVWAPGANARSTEVRWDPTAERLLVGVWCGKPPQRIQPPLAFPVPELSWFATFHLPGFAGEQARVSVERGLIRVRVPRVAPQLPPTVVEHRLPTQGDDDGPPPLHALDLFEVQAA